MAYPDKTLRRDMHQEPPDKLSARNSDLFPISLIFVVFDSKCNSRPCHAFDPVITDSNTVRVLAKVFDHRLCTTEWLLTIRYPLFIK